MPLFFGFWSARRRVLIAAVAVLGALTLLLWRKPAQVAQPATSAPQALTARYGPGVWSPRADLPDTPSPSAGWGTEPPPGPDLEPDGSVRVDRGLRDLFDYYLLGGHSGSRAEHVAALRMQLQFSLAAPAFAQAWELVERYLIYLDEHDRLLARESAPAVSLDSPFVAVDGERIGAWIAQRTRLRQTALGMRVAHLWFGEEDREMQEVLASLGAGREQLPPRAEENDALGRAAHALREMHARAEPLDVRRGHVAAQFGETAAVRYAEMEREEQAWQTRLDAYRQQADMIRGQIGLSAEDSARQIDALRAQSFPDDAEQLRARSLDAR